MILKLLAGILILIACYLSWWAIAYSAPIWFFAASIPALCGVGLTLHRYWACYLWYLIAVGISTWWIFSTVQLALTGWPVHGAVETIFSLLPGALLLVVCFCGSLAVRRNYKTIGRR